MSSALPEVHYKGDYLCHLYIVWGTRWHSWLRHCATSKKVAGSIPDGVIGIFHRYNPSGRSKAPGVDSASNINEYKEYFLGVKTAGA